MCQACSKGSDAIDYKIKSAESTIQLCPNCVAERVEAHMLVIPEGTGVSEISGKPGAVTVEVHNGITYTVTPDEALRLLEHSLMPSEFLCLSQKHTQYVFDLHDDFYSDRGLAYQPALEDEYTVNLREWIDNKLPKLPNFTKRDKILYNRYVEQLESEPHDL